MDQAPVVTERGVIPTRLPTPLISYVPETPWIPTAGPLPTAEVAPHPATQAVVVGETHRRVEVSRSRTGLDLSSLQGPAAAGVALAGAALVTGVSIDLAKGKLFAPTPTDRPSIRLSGSPSLEGGTITLSGTF
jgi:hypothetical protein